jgi:hypothetical protein
MATSYSNHKFYEQARRAYCWTSFDPEKRAEWECAYYDDCVTKLTEAGKESYVERFTKYFLHSLAAKGRCASSAITGPARFPVARMEKYRNWEQNITQAMFDFFNKAMRPPAPPRTELDYGMEAKEYEIKGVKIIHNLEANRLQLIYPNKPEEETRTQLKKHGFKWSPRFGAWQRQLTPNAIHSAGYVLNN